MKNRVKAAFSKMVGAPVNVQGVGVPYILQIGAGDKSDESETSYNNQNVFCHTWSMFIGTVCIMFYNPKLGFIESVQKLVADIAHYDNLLNLAMIKRFAYWLTGYLTDLENVPVSIRATRKLETMLVKYFLAYKPYDGLKYIWCYKNDVPISVEDIAISRKLKFDIEYIDEKLGEYTISGYRTLMATPRCHDGYELSATSKRCHKKAKEQTKKTKKTKKTSV